MSAFNTRDCQAAVSSIFIFESPEVQRGCNMVYANISTMDSVTKNNASGNGNYIRFKSDLERMQFILGQYGIAKPCERK